MSDTAVYMFNALWFKPDGGAEKYREYMLAASPIVAKYGAKVVQEPLAPGQAIIGEFDADLIFFVEWESMQVFQQMVGDPEYQKISHLREEALTKSLLVPCQPIARE